jgi:isopenicillin N synthase-like dioxygenase
MRLQKQPQTELLDDIKHSQGHGIRDSALHGRNQWPAQRPELKSAVMAHVKAMEGLGAAVMRGVALGLGLPATFFTDQDRGAPYWCTRVIHYPPLARAGSAGSEEAARTADKALAGAKQRTHTRPAPMQRLPFQPL